jgi:hypothetical protein
MFYNWKIGSSMYIYETENTSGHVITEIVTASGFIYENE